uniref:DUF223 domain-containing protein n=1 Tax=Brassica campestris TaxID=3711 RepID=M4DEJ5_BRACM
MTKVFFSDLKAGRCSFVVEARLLRFWEAKNVKRGGELMWMDLLMVDVNVSSLVNEAKRNLFGSSFDVSDSGLTFEMNAPSQRTRVGRAVKPTQKFQEM